MSCSFMRQAICLLAVASVALVQSSCNLVAESERNEKERIFASVRSVLEAQEAAWNRGDIEGFMEGYHRSDETLFISGDDVKGGWQTVMERYRKNYDSREKMGTLQFSELEMKQLNQFYVMVWGRWQLTRAQDRPHGRFTLLFRRTDKGWRIVHDHTSSAK